MTEEPLVSIIVITYNSSKYVLETLESCKAQTYKNLELIISDDGSTDETVHICQEWLDKNQHYFVNSELITVYKNSGIPANCNRGVKASQGEWIKLIAGDDVLKNDAIQNFLDFLNYNKQIKILHSEIEYFENNLKDTRKSSYNKRNFFLLDSEKQYQKLLHKNSLNAPSVIFAKSLFNEVNGFDENFMLIEDYPFWMMVTKRGHKIWFLNKVTVYYRIHNQSVQRNNSPFVSSNFIRETTLVYRKYRSKDLSVIYNLRIKLKYKLLIFLNKLGFNNSNKSSKLLYFLVYRL